MKMPFDEAMRLKDRMPKGMFRRVEGQAADEIWLAAIEVAEQYHGILQPPLKTEPAQEPVAWASEIIDALHAQYDTEMIQENDSGDALIRLDDAIAAVEEAEKFHTTPPQRPPLTDEEIDHLWRDPQQGDWDYRKFVRAIERKVRGEA